MPEYVDSPEYNDNRNYDYTAQAMYVRAEFPIIAEWIPSGSRVIDLGCANGALMKYLKDQKHVDIQGIEIAPSGVAACQAVGLKAVAGSIDKHATYQSYTNGEFDYAICNVTMPMVMYPEVVVQEMKRIARHQIISFPNFAYMGNRLDMLLRGRVPRPMLYGYTWYSTGLIHQLSIKDFKELCRTHGLRILKSDHLGVWRNIARVFLPNVFSKEGIYLCEPDHNRKYKV
jgi:methionine biosynthesis protein MetW